jgi:hypothetical protein
MNICLDPISGRAMGGEEKQRIEFEQEARRCAIAAAVAREAQIDAALANLSDETLGRIRTRLAVELGMINPRLGESAHKMDPRKAPHMRAKVWEIFFATGAETQTNPARAGRAAGRASSTPESVSAQITEEIR